MLFGFVLYTTHGYTGEYIMYETKIDKFNTAFCRLIDFALVSGVPITHIEDALGNKMRELEEHSTFHRTELEEHRG